MLPHDSIYRSPDVDLNKYQIDHLQPTDDFNRRWNRAIDALATFLKQNSGFRVAETVKVCR